MSSRTKRRSLATYRTIGREIDRLSGLVDDLFGLSRLHAGAWRLQMAPISLDALVSDAVMVVSLAGRAKGVDVGADVRSPSTEVELSVPEMGRVLRNLLENAIRHTPAGGAIRVQAGVDCQVAVVSVQDSCGGIPAADLPRVFEPAYRGDVARASDGGGGLGLAVARGLVDAHHARSPSPTRAAAAVSPSACPLLRRLRHETGAGSLYHGAVSRAHYSIRYDGVPAE